MNDLKFQIEHATSQREIVDILKQFHIFDAVINSLRLNYRIGYNAHPTATSHCRRTRLDKLKICIIDAVSNNI